MEKFALNFNCSSTNWWTSEKKLELNSLLGFTTYGDFHVHGYKNYTPSHL